ncbi:MAG: heme exporter protein CcmD [Chromatiales bacterium]|jgi:heme exporter protein D
MTLSEFLHMGGYAFYVWMSYGIAFVVLVANIIIPLRVHRRLLQRLVSRARRERRMT